MDIGSFVDTELDGFPGRRAGSHRFDGPGGTLVHAAVADAVARYLGGELVANDHGGFPASDFSDAIVSWTTERVRALLGAVRGQVVFGPNMTGLTTVFVRALGLGAGDEVIITELDHEANRAPWQALAAQGVVVREAPLGPSGVLPAEAVTGLLTERTKWVAVTAASNALGTVPDVASISRAAHAVGARVFVDGVQAVAHLPIDVAALGCDAFVTAAYKWYGTHAGILWVADGDGLHLPEQVPSAERAGPGHLQLGTLNFEAILGAGVAADVLLRCDRAAIATREDELRASVRARLGELPGIRLLGPAGGTALVTFQLDGVPAAKVAAHLASRSVSVWHGTFYAVTAMRAVTTGDPDAVRAGISCYTTGADVDALVAAVAELT
ncbi:aminotransferase class V-fold PLP-dependent enzyme [Amycolatopsis sp. cmx-4-61]|uniref:aminotransferase class V-fold PLP-dependent enzyme n=1 Tax=Amycolatopsis sp. cmx-4-61 TaxID=2790937 RepID=UPI00397B9DD4